jgi:hypothetical protein
MIPLRVRFGTEALAETLEDGAGRPSSRGCCKPRPPNIDFSPRYPPSFMTGPGRPSSRGCSWPRLPEIEIVLASTIIQLPASLCAWPRSPKTYNSRKTISNAIIEFLLLRHCICGPSARVSTSPRIGQRWQLGRVLDFGGCPFDSVHNETSHAVFHNFGYCAFVVGDNRCATRHGFDHHKPGWLLPLDGKDECHGTTEKRTLSV